MKSYDALYEQGFFTPQNSNAVLELLSKENPDYYKKRTRAKRLGQVKGFIKGLAFGGICAGASYLILNGIDLSAEKLSDPNFSYFHIPNWMYAAGACLAMMSPVIFFTDSEGKKADIKFGLENKLE